MPYTFNPFTGDLDFYQKDTDLPVNFLKLSNKAWDAEAGTTGWSTYKDTAAARPVDGTGGTATVVSALTTTTTTPLSGTRSFLLQKGSGNAQGEGWSVDFSIDNAHLARVLQVEFDYQVVSGDFIAGNTQDFTTAGDSSLIVYLYDVTNNQLIEPTTFRLYSNSTNIADKFVGNFQTSANSTSYRLIFHVARIETAAWTLKVDNIIVKPAKYTYGTPITDWQTFTPQLLGSITNPSLGSTGTIRGRWRRVGDNCEVNYAVYFNGTGISNGSGAYRFTLPPGITINTSKLAETISDNFSTIGSGVYQAGGSAANTRVIVPFVPPGTVDRLALVQNNGSTVTSGSIPGSFTAGDYFHLTASVPVNGWSSSVKIAEPMELRDVVFKINNIASPSFSIPSGTIDTIKSPSWSVTLDTVASWNTSTSPNRYEIKQSGFYLISMLSQVPHPAPPHHIRFGYGINGTSFNKFTENQNTYSANVTFYSLSDLVYLNAGDYLVFGYSSSVAGINIINDGRHHSITIARLPSSQALAQSEVVAVKALNTSGQLLQNATNTQITNWTKQYDTHNCFNHTTGVFTAPVSGYYRAVIALFVHNPGTGEYSITFGSNSSYSYATSQSWIQVRHQETVYLNAGQQMTIGFYQNSGSNKNLSTGSNYNLFAIEKIG